MSPDAVSVGACNTLPTGATARSVDTATPVFSDDAVIQSVREGHTRNFEILVERYKKKTVLFIHRMINDPDEAQSLAQDVFINIFESLNRYRPRDTFQSYLFTVAKNITFNYLKKQKRLLFFSSFLSPRDEQSHFQTPETQYLELERTRQDELIAEGLRRLKENQRLAFILKIYLDFSYQKIAEITGWSEPKIETLISRARSELTEYVREHSGGAPAITPSQKGKEKKCKI